MNPNGPSRFNKAMIIIRQGGCCSMLCGYPIPDSNNKEAVQHVAMQVG